MDPSDYHPQPLRSVHTDLLQNESLVDDGDPSGITSTRSCNRTFVKERKMIWETAPPNADASKEFLRAAD